MRRRLVGVIAAVMLVGASVTGTVSPAVAAPNDCGLGHACLYSGYRHVNDPWQNWKTLRLGYCIDKFTNHFYNDIASSVFNNGREDRLFLYEHEDQKGAHATLDRGRSYDDLGVKGLNDQVSSAYFESQRGKTGKAQCL